MAQISQLRGWSPSTTSAFPRALEIHRLLDEVVKEVEGARARIDRDAAAPIATSVQILCFEHPIERWPFARTRPRSGGNLTSRPTAPLRRSRVD